MTTKVSLSEIYANFELLIANEKLREEVSNWATRLQRLHDDGKLKFDPPKDKDVIWKAIDYLTGVDLPTVEREYLHSVDDFKLLKLKIEEMAKK